MLSAQRWLKWFAVFGSCTLVGLLFAGQWYVGYTANGYPVTWLQVSTWALTEWWLWALLAPFILWCAHRFYIDRDNRTRTIPIHIAIGLGFSFIHIVHSANLTNYAIWNGCCIIFYGIAWPASFSHDALCSPRAFVLFYLVHSTIAICL